MKIDLYPLKFKPITQYRIWGGDRLNSVLPKDEQIDNLGEIWSLSNIENNISIVSEGKLVGKSLSDLLDTYQADLVGEKVWKQFGSNFPLLIKFLDSAQPLSVQVHPNDQLAQTRHNAFGKSEMWYIIEHEPDAELIIGFEESIDSDKYLEHLANDSLEEILHYTKVSKGDVYYLPAGRIHAIGKGITLAEIQQTSDITYRIYDYNRIDKDGNKRELHADLALNAIEFNKTQNAKTPYSKSINQFETLINTPYFTTKIYSGEQEVEIQNKDEMRIFLCTEGSAQFQTKESDVHLKKYESILIPAKIDSFKIIPTQHSTFIEVKVP